MSMKQINKTFKELNPQTKEVIIASILLVLSLLYLA